MLRGKRAGQEMVDTAKPRRKRTRTAVKEGIAAMLTLLKVLPKQTDTSGASLVYMNVNPHSVSHSQSVSVRKHDHSSLLCKDLGCLTYARLFDACVSPVLDYAAGGLKKKNLKM